MERLLTFKQLVARGYVGNRVTLSRWIKAGEFPAPIHVGPRLLRWRIEELEQWEKGRWRARNVKKARR